MRIIGGTAGGIVLRAPKGMSVRPTPDLMRQAVFNSLGTRIENAHLLELFAGTGALSLESLSRGAASALCVELSRKHAEFIKNNVRAAHLAPGSLELRVQDVFVAIGQLVTAQRTFDMIFADPPYGDKNVGKRSQSFAQQLLDDERVPELLTTGGLFILGHARRDTLTLPEARWEEIKLLKHGDNIMRFLKPISSPATPPKPPTPCAPSDGTPDQS